MLRLHRRFLSKRSLTKKRPRTRLKVELLEKRQLLAAGILDAGEILADYTFAEHRLNNGAEDLFSRDTATNSTASAITSPLTLGSTGNGQPTRALRLGPNFNRTNSVGSASNVDDYIEFAITPNAGQALNLDFLTFAMYRNESNAKNSYAVYYDQAGPGSDNFNSLLDVGQINSQDTWEAVNVSLRDRPDLTNLTTEAKFRIFFWGEDGIGDLHVDNIRVHEVGSDIVGSSYAHYGPSDRLIHPLDERGNRVPNFSAAGYKYGDEPIPDLDALFTNPQRIITVAPGAGDDTMLIQNAIDQVSNFTQHSSGFRGLVQLTAGEFQINDQLLVNSSGVVLRGVGDGDDPANDTILRGTGTDKRSLVVVGDGVDPSQVQATRREIVDEYVPVGATSFNVDDASEFAVGMEIRIVRPSPQNWITDIEMDQIPPRNNGGTVRQWPAGAYNIEFERVITRIEGDRIFFNAPVLNSFDQQYGGGRVYQLIDPRITNVGIESIRGKSDFVSDTDEDHATSFIQLRAVKDAWVRNVTGQHFVYATVWAGRQSKAVTVEDARSLDPKSIITGARRYAFNIEGQFILMKDLYSEEGRHDFVNNSSGLNHGPNVFLNGVSERAHSTSGPHQRWSTGTLYDTITTSQGIEARDAGNAGTGHGWRGANMVFWNVTAPDLLMQNPITAQNWAIGATGTLQGITSNTRDAANMDSRNQRIDFGDDENPTNSLYVAQRNDVDRNPDLQTFEYLLGDYDLGIADNSDGAGADAQWVSTVAANSNLGILQSMDGVDQDGILPLSFAPDLMDEEVVVSAVLSIGIRDLDDAQAGELWIESASNRHSFSSLGFLDVPTFNRTQTLTVELTGADLDAFADGRLDLAVSDAVVDWINVSLLIGEQTAFIEQTVEDGTRVLVEEFDRGGSSVAYDDSTRGNAGGQARLDDDVDLFAGSVVASNITDGEWLEFTRDIVPGYYDIDVRAWSSNDNLKSVRVLVAANASSQTFTELGSIAIPNTNNVRLSHTIEGVDLTAWGGEDRVIRVEFEGNDFLYDWIEFNNQLDFGDAPASYGTLLDDDGARHLIAAGPQLGANRDAEDDGTASPDADGDGSDEDGVMFGSIGAESSGAAVNIALGGTGPAKVDAWIDFNQNNTFDVNEKVLDSISVTQSMQTLNYDLPTGLTQGDYYARVRLSTEGGLSPVGFAADGEVEDYVVSVVGSPKVQSIEINRGNDQRSSIDTVRVVFDGVVDIDDGNPFRVTPVGSSEVIPLQNPIIQEISNKTVVDLTFVSGGSHTTSFGSLRDGEYELKIDASRVTSAGVWLGGEDGSATDPYVNQAVEAFFRKYGDADGDGGVGLADFARFRSTFGSTDGDTGYLAGLDSDGDRRIGLTDFAAFRGSFGR